MPRVSIVMPVYSGERFLREALDSIVQQTYTDWELIAVNEYGSSQAATDILREYAARDDRIRVIQNEKRLFIAESLNVGLRAAKGEYIARMDADDISKPERLQRQVDFLDTNPQIIICGTHIEGVNGEPIDWDIEEDCEQVATDILFFSPFVHPTVMFRRSVVETYGIYYNPKFVASEDYDFFQRVCSVGKAVNLPETLFRYRLHADNATEKNRSVGATLYEDAMARGFNQFGLSFTAEEMSLLSPHKCLKGAAGQEIIARLSKLLQLLKRIFYANERKGVYPRKYFSHTLYKRFCDARKSVSWACDSIDWRAVDSFCNCAIFRHPYFFEGKKFLDSKAGKTPLISVLLPTYNSEDYIIETIDSVLRQTLDDFEILVINEFGSDDQTTEIIEMFHDDRIRIVQNEKRLGLAESLNKGMKMARGKYIARIDADDLSSPDRFEKQVRFLEEHPDYGVCGAWQHHFGPDTDMIHRVPVDHEALKAQLLYRCELCHSTLMLRREAFIDNGLFYDASRAAEDYELWTRAVYCFKFANLPEVLGEYRLGGGNITAQKIDKLSRESGEICASLLRQHLGIHVEAGHIPFMSNWTNEFNKILNPKALNSRLQREKKLLEQMWVQNEKRHVYAPEELLYAINKRWRWVTNNWVYATDLGTIYSIDELFVQYPILADNRRKGAVILWVKNMLGIPKKGLKKCLKPFFRPIRVRLEAQTDQLKRQMWDVEGHLKDALQDVKREVWDNEGHLKDQYRAFETTVDERITMLQKEIDALKTAVKNAEAAAVGAVDSRIRKAEENLTQAVDSRVWKAEENLSKTVDSRVWKAEENLSKTVDSRVWKAEEDLTQAVDSRVWKVEENLSKTVDSRAWKVEENLSKTVDSRVWKAEENLTQAVDSRVWKAEENILQTMDGRIWKAEQNFARVGRSAEQYAESALTALTKKKRIFLIGTPEHNNIGDAAITVGEMEFICRAFPERRLIEVPFDDLDIWYEVIRAQICPGDVICLQGGGNMGNRYLSEEAVRRRIIGGFLDVPVVILPQTAFYDSGETGQKELAYTAGIFNRHPDLTIMARGEQSLKLMRAHFPAAKSACIPDMAFMLDEDRGLERKGILLCIRALNDESGLNEAQYDDVFAAVRDIDPEADITDNLYESPIYRSMRRSVVDGQLRRFASRQVVVTDRLHGLIFALITRTPCVVLSSYNYKIGDFLRTFVNSDGVFFLDNDPSQLESSIRKAMEHGPLSGAGVDMGLFEKACRMVDGGE